MSAVSYMTGQMAELAMNVVVGIIAKMRGVTVVWHNGTAIDADIFTKTIRIPRVACASMLSQEALMLMRGGVYHEAGHILCTKLDKSQWPKGALMEIWNGVEDRWMEREMRNKFPGANVVLPAMSKYYNKKIAKQIALEGVDAPLWEALCGMGFMADGIIPAWRFTPKAQLYYDAGYTTFIKWKKCKTSKGTLKVAKELYDVLKQVNEEVKAQQPPQGQSNPQKEEGEQGEPQEGEGQGQGEQQEGEGQEQGEQQQGQGESEQGDEQGEPQQGGCKDFDDYEDEQGEKGQGKQEEGGQGEKEEGEEGEGEQGEGKQGEAGEEGDEEGEGSGNEQGEDGDEADEGEQGGSKGESGEGDTEGDEADKSAESGDEGTEKGDEADDGAGEPGDGTYNKDDNGTENNGEGHEEGDDGDRTWEEIAAMETAMGKDIKETVNDELAEQLTEMAEDHQVYIARRDLDEHIIPKGNKNHYERERKKISSAVMVLTRALDQSLRILSKKRKSCGLRNGRFDQRRLVQAATGLSKNVFCKTSQGITLDTVVSIVIDESGSMGNMHEVRRMAIAIGEALTKIGVEFEVIGTTTKHWSGHRALSNMDGFDRTNPIMYRHYKIFGEQWRSVAHRTSEMSARQHNVDGESVEYCAYRLAERKEKRKVIFSICDGEPYAGHHNSGVMGKNLKDVCRKVREAGIEVYGFGIGETGPKEYYGADHFIYLEDSASLGPDFVRKFASIVTGGRVKIGKTS